MMNILLIKFFKKLNKLIKDNFYPDVISMTTFVDYKNKLRIKFTLPHPKDLGFIKIISIIFCLEIILVLFLSLVIRYKKNLPFFDTKLKWLVDVDFYQKIKKFKNWIFTDDLFLISDQKNDVSLTLKYNFMIKDLYKNESKLIFHRFKLKFIFLDHIVWVLLRISNKFKYFINIKNIQMIKCYLFGGIGNQMFQYLSGIYLSKQNNTKVKFDYKFISSFNSQHNNKSLNEIFNLEDKFFSKETNSIVLNFNKILKFFFNLLCIFKFNVNFISDHNYTNKLNEKKLFNVWVFSKYTKN